MTYEPQKRHRRSIRLKGYDYSQARAYFVTIGAVPPEVWNRLGTKILPKLRSGSDLKVVIEFSVTVNRNVREA